jgi:hypothetical protein
MFAFENTLNDALNQLNQFALFARIQNVAYGVLFISVLISVYQAFAGGGDVRKLAVALIKYVAISLTLASYDQTFRLINSSVLQVAHIINDTAGAGDVLVIWQQQMSASWQATGFLTIWQAIESSFNLSIINLLLSLVAYIIYPFAYALFIFFYSLYGTILYVIGPLVISVLPILGVGQIARQFMTNFMIFNCWAILYAVMNVLLKAINIHNVAAMGTNFLGQFDGIASETLLSLVSILYAISIALIPKIASRIFTGDVGGTMSAMQTALGQTVRVATAGIAGVVGGLAAARAASAGGSVGTLGGSTATQSAIQSAPPTPPAPPAGSAGLRHTLPPAPPDAPGSSGSKASVPGGQPKGPATRAQGTFARTSSGGIVRAGVAKADSPKVPLGTMPSATVFDMSLADGLYSWDGTTSTNDRRSETTGAKATQGASPWALGGNTAGEKQPAPSLGNAIGDSKPESTAAGSAGAAKSRPAKPGRYSGFNIYHAGGYYSGFAMGLALDALRELRQKDK